MQPPLMQDHVGRRQFTCASVSRAAARCLEASSAGTALRNLDYALSHGLQLPFERAEGKRGPFAVSAAVRRCCSLVYGLAAVPLDKLVQVLHDKFVHIDTLSH